MRISDWSSDVCSSDLYEFRLVAGAPFTELGPATVWGRLKLPLLAGQEIHPLDRVLTLADFPNGIGNSVAFDRFAYINPDLTVALHRQPTRDRKSTRLNSSN